MRLLAICFNLVFALFLSVEVYSAETFHTFRSLDDGGSWQTAGSGLPRSARVNAFGAIGSTALAATDQGIFLSRDLGQSWEPSGYTNKARPLCFAALGTTVYAGTADAGVLTSSDRGQSWHASHPDLDRLTVRSLRAWKNTLWAGTDRAGVFRSTDGNGWIPFSEGLPAGAQIHQMSALGDTLFVALYNKGLYRRNPSEGVWTRAGHVVPLALATLRDTLIAGHNPGGLHWSVDAGSTWSPARSAREHSADTLDFAGPAVLRGNDPVWAIAANSQRAFAGAAEGLFYSPDGRNWLRAAAGLPPISPAIAFLAGDKVVLATIVVKE